jgi:hypothetical protein
MSSPAPRRTLADLERTVRAIATEFQTDTVFVIGSQAILADWPDAPPALTASPEIDAFPENARIWEVSEKSKHPDMAPEASEHINALFGEGSQFHRTHGFFIDGVDDTTAKLPADWRRRAIIRNVEMPNGRTVRAIVPSPEDIVVSKLARLDEKDRDYIKAFHAARPLDPDVIEKRIRASGVGSAIEDRAISFIRELERDRSS